MVSCVGVSRVILVVLNILLFCVGTGLTVVGILVRFSPSTITALPLADEEIVQEINRVINSTFVDIAAWVCIAVGVIIIIVSLCGCVGSAFTKSTLLGIYICVILQIIVIQLGIGIIIYLSPDWFNTAVASNFETHLNDTKSGGEVSDISIGWNVLQLSVGCCGLNGTTSYSSVGPQPTCCTVSDRSTAAVEYLDSLNNVTLPVNYENRQTCFNQTSQLNAGKTIEDRNYVNNIGCVEKIYETIQMLAIILIALVAIEIFILVISCVVCCNDREEGKV